MSGCQCSLATRLVGDGCKHCNPAMYVEILEQRCEDLELELATLRLTDEEREAIERGYCSLMGVEDMSAECSRWDAEAAATLRGLLDRSYSQSTQK